MKTIHLLPIGALVPVFTPKAGRLAGTIVLVHSRDAARPVSQNEREAILPGPIEIVVEPTADSSNGEPVRIDHIHIYAADGEVAKTLYATTFGAIPRMHAQSGRVAFDPTYRKLPKSGIAVGFFTDPWGTHPELTPGLVQVP